MFTVQRSASLSRLACAPSTLSARVSTLRQLLFLTSPHSTLGVPARMKPTRCQGEKTEDKTPGASLQEGVNPSSLRREVSDCYHKDMGRAYGDGYTTRSEDEGFGQIYGEPAGVEEEEEEGNKVEVPGLARRGNTAVDAAPHEPKKDA